MQLEFFPISREEQLEREVTKLQASLDKLRKSVFARHGETVTMYTELSNEFEKLKESVVNGKD